MDWDPATPVGGAVGLAALRLPRPEGRAEALGAPRGLLHPGPWEGEGWRRGGAETPPKQRTHETSGENHLK